MYLYYYLLFLSVSLILNVNTRISSNKAPLICMAFLFKGNVQGKSAFMKMLYPFPARLARRQKVRSLFENGT